MDTRLLPVRILYTINNSPQYILARSFNKLPTTHVPFQRPPTSHYPRPVNEPDDTVAGHSWNQNGIKYAICPLRPCLDAICRSSPELLQDSNRDFSVYILDPLESLSSSTPNPSSSSSSLQLPPDQLQQHPRGVAVGLGLMSWVLLADEDTSEVIQVTGTVMTLGNGEEALEVIFALRETSHMQKASLSPTLKSWGLPPPPVIAPSKRSKQSSAHHSHSNTNSRASSSSKRHGHSTSSATKENANGKGKSKVLGTSGSSSASLGLGLGGEGIASGDGRFEALVRNLQKAHDDAVHDSSTAATQPPTSTSTTTPPAFTHPPRGESESEPPNPTPTTRYARSTDFPLSNSQIWCGPQPRAKVGRPPKSSKGGLFTREPLDKARSRSGGGEGKGKERSGGGEEMDENTQMTLLSLLSVLSGAAGGGDQATNGVLLNALGAIDSASGSGGNGGEGGTSSPALANALKELLAAACGPTTSNLTLTNTNTSDHPRSRSHPNSHTTQTGEGEDEIIVLDKENVNPGAFRRKGEKGEGNGGSAAAAGKESSAVDGGGSGTGPGTGTGEKARLRLGERSGNGNGNMRKRTLSDFMEEKDAERERERIREAAISGKKRTGPATSSSSTQHAQSDMDYPFSSSASSSRVFSNSVLTANLAFRANTSPPRPTPTFGLPFQRAVSFNSTASTSTATSPAATPDPLPSTPTAAITNPAPPAKKYVVPTWARTTTTTRPRLSEEVLAQRAAVAAEAEAEAEKERKKRKGRGGGRRKQSAKGGETGKDAENESGREGTKEKKKRPQLATNSNLLSLPICASSDVTVVAPSSPLPASSPASTSESSTAATPFASEEPLVVPKTPPPRHRHRHTLTPLSKSVIGASGGGSALFTPTPSKSNGLFNSPLFSPSVSASNRKQMKISPIRAVTTGKGWDGDDDDDEEERLSRELDDALEELDVPSSSLPIASSDFETEPSSSSGGHFSASEEQDGGDDTMRYWSTGLPPSSPPPPTSPILQSQTDDEDMEDIANEMSDSDGLTFEQDPLDPQHQQFISGTSSLDYGMNSDISFSDDLAMCFEDFNEFFSDPMTISDNTTSLLPLPSSDPVVQNGLADFDFTQFWESVKPLVDNQSMSSDNLASDGMEADLDGMGEIDHVKLAEEVHALFSGCLM